MSHLNMLGVLALVVTLGACGSSENDAAPQSSEADADAVSVRVVRAEPAAIQTWIYSQGTARALRREFLSFESAGRVAYVNPSLKIGRPVRRGQVIAYQQPNRSQSELTGARAGLESARADLSVARASQREAAANLELARETFERYRILLDQNSASEQEYDEAEAQLAQASAAKAKADAQIGALGAQVDANQAQVSTAQVTVSESRIVSPISGVLARLNVEKGRYFSPQTVNTQSEQGALSTVPAVVIDPSSYEITIDLPSYAFRQLEVGSNVLIMASEAPGRGDSGSGGRVSGSSSPPLPVQDFEIRGVVDAISPSLDPEKRTFQAKIRTTAGSASLQDGEFVSVWMEGREAQNALAVPFNAMRYQNGKPFLFVYDPKTGKVDEREVKLGAQGADQIQVVSGLRRGELVVTEGRAGLSEGDRVRIIGKQRQPPRVTPTPRTNAAPPK